MLREIPQVATAISPPPLTGQWARRFALLAPLVGFIALAGAFAARLDSDPSLVPSPLIGKPVPEFSLPAVNGRELGLSSANLKSGVTLVNVFASWCVACREEHPVFMQL